MDKRSKCKENFFINIVSNAIIIILVIAVAFFAFSDSAVNVFTPHDAPIFNGDRGSNKVSLMFNVYQGNDEILRILEILDENNIKCTFFLGGIWVKNNPEVFFKILSRGHEIGNHGYNHLEHSRLSDEADLKEISDTHSLIKQFSGLSMTLFAPPSGDFDKQNLRNASSLGYVTVLWSKDTIDWRDQDSPLIIRRATKNLKGGDLVLMHPTPATVESLQDIIDYCKENGLKIVTVGQNINY